VVGYCGLLRRFAGGFEVRKDMTSLIVKQRCYSIVYML
jgi:hypothetical protein